MIKKLLIFALFFSLSSCGGFEFVYKLNKNLQTLNGFTDTSVNGDDSNQVYSLLKESIGDNNSSSAKYKLLVNSTRIEAAEIIEKDATASKFRITFYISYKIYYLAENCKIFDEEIKTVSFYNAKAAGYSFATDLSQKDSITQNIRKNKSEFISKLNKIKAIDVCGD